MSLTGVMEIIITSIAQSNNPNDLLRFCTCAIKHRGLEAIISQGGIVGISVGQNSENVAKELTETFKNATGINFIAISNCNGVDSKDSDLSIAFDSLLNGSSTCVLVGGVWPSLKMTSTDQSHQILDDIGNSVYVMLLDRRLKADESKNQGNAFGRIFYYRQCPMADKMSQDQPEYSTIIQEILDNEIGHLHFKMPDSSCSVMSIPLSVEEQQKDKSILILKLLCSALNEKEDGPNILSIVGWDSSLQIFHNIEMELFNGKINTLRSGHGILDEDEMFVKEYYSSFVPEKVREGEGQRANILTTISSGQVKILDKICSENGLKFESILECAYHLILSIYGNHSQTLVINHTKINDTSLDLFVPIILKHSHPKSSNLIKLAQQLEKDKQKLLQIVASAPHKFSVSNYLNLTDCHGLFHLCGSKKHQTEPQPEAYKNLNIIRFWREKDDLVEIEGIGSTIEIRHVVNKFKEFFNTNFYQQQKQVFNQYLNLTKSLTLKYLTTRDVDYIVDDDVLDRIQKISEIENVFIANTLQQRFIARTFREKNKSVGTYIIQSVIKYNVPIDLPRYKRAWQIAQAKFASLRLRFDWEDKIIQIVDKNPTLDWRLCNESDFQSLDNLLMKDRKEGFDLTAGRLFRIYIIQHTDSTVTFVFSFHRAILDDWSSRLLFTFVYEMYFILESKPNLIVEPDQTYQEAQLYLQNLPKQDMQYWNKLFTTIDWSERIDLSGLFSANTRGIDKIENEDIKTTMTKTLPISGKLYSTLNNLGRQNGFTLNAILQYAWHLVLRLYGGGNTTLVAATISGRNIPIVGIESAIGMFINTLPIALTQDTTSNIINSIKNIQNQINELNSRSNADLTKVLAASGDTSRLFDSLFVYNVFSSKIHSGDSRFKIENESKEIEERTEYPLSILVVENSERTGVDFRLAYACDIFDSLKIQGIIETIHTLLVQIADAKLEEEVQLDWLSYEKRQLILQSFNRTTCQEMAVSQGKHQRPITSCKYPLHRTAHEQFEIQAKLFPDAIAVIYKDIRMTYFELNVKANNLANYLVKHYHVQHGDMIGLCIERCDWQIIAMFGIWKSGCAYVPIAPDYPSLRIQHILKDTQLRVVLSTTNILTSLQLKVENIAGLTLVSIDNNFLNNEIECSNDIRPICKSTDLAYVIYTSGTTGTAKGVLVEHKGLINYSYYLTEYFNFAQPPERELILEVFNIVFDSFLDPITMSLLQGHTLVLAPPSLEEITNENSLFKEITYVIVTPSLLSALELNLSDATSLKRVVVCGEVLTEAAFNILSSLPSNPFIFNAYGPTEATLIMTIQPMKSYSKQIGKPIANTSAYVLDKKLRPLPINVVGEIYIGGVGVARGYLNKPELTKEKFIQNPFTEDEQWMYKTGDMGKWLNDGSLEYVGRRDFQVKIRGQRIELSEIESVLSKNPNIKHCVVLAKESKILIAYYISKTNNKLDERTLLEELMSQLPQYMIPSTFVQMTEFPLTPSGKLNRSALPDPCIMLKSDMDYKINPCSLIEIAMCEIFANILNLPFNCIGIESDFFRLGGDSILSIQLVKRLSSLLGVAITITDIFKHRTIGRLLKHANIQSQSPSYFEQLYWQNQLKYLKLFKNDNDYANNEIFIETIISEEVKPKLMNDKEIDNFDLIILTAINYGLSKSLTKTKVNHIAIANQSAQNKIFPLRLESKSNHMSSLKYTVESLNTGPKDKCTSWSAQTIGLNTPDLFYSTIRSNLKPKEQLHNQTYILRIFSQVQNNCPYFRFYGKGIRFETLNELKNIFEHTFTELLKELEPKGFPPVMSDHLDFEQFVNINSENESGQDRLFLFSPGEGGAESYMGNIVPRISPFLSLTVFNNYYVYLEKKYGLDYVCKNYSIENIAEDHINVMKGIQSIGPYNLGGWSLGGILSCEIARQLVRDGNEVNMVFLIDSILPNTHLVNLVSQLDKLKGEVGQFNLMKNYAFKQWSLKASDVKKIILFKADQIDKTNCDVMTEFSKYIVECAPYNNLDDLVEKDAMLVYPIHANHMNWVNNESVIQSMANIISSCFNPSQIN